MYFSCSVLTFLAIIAFLLAILTSFTTAATHFACIYADGALETKAEFVYRFNPIFKNQVLSQMVAECATR